MSMRRKHLYSYERLSEALTKKTKKGSHSIKSTGPKFKSSLKVEFNNYLKVLPSSENIKGTNIF